MLGEYVIELSSHTEDVRFCAEHWQQFQAALAEHGARRAWPAKGSARQGQARLRSICSDAKRR
jgi:hypothetical protein